MSSIINDRNRNNRNIKLSIPSHVSWSFDGIEFAPITNARNSTFEFKYTIDKNIRPTNLVDSVRAAIINLYERASMPFSLCISGADSEIIARETSRLGIPFEFYCMDYWGVNGKTIEKAKTLSKELNVYLNIIPLTKEEAYDSVLPKNYAQLQAEKPSYLCIPYLLENIPEDTFIIGGEGEPMKGGAEYECLADSNGMYNGIPISITEVQFRQWAILNNRASEMYFYSSNPTLLKSYFYHPLLIKENKKILTRKIVDTMWPNLTFNEKTTNWENQSSLNYEIRMYLRTLNKESLNRYRPNVCLAQI